MGKHKKPEKSSDFKELRVYIDPRLAEALSHEAAKERRNQGKQLEIILEERYFPPQPKEPTDVEPKDV